MRGRERKMAIEKKPAGARGSRGSRTVKTLPNGKPDPASLSDRQRRILEVIRDAVVLRVIHQALGKLVMLQDFNPLLPLLTSLKS